nr:immunoglobulin heavy chain junction region [Mus musculus]
CARSRDGHYVGAMDYW